MASERGKIRTGAPTGFQLRRLPVRSESRQGQTHTGLKTRISSPICPVRELMSLIGLLTATEKQVHLG